MRILMVSARFPPYMGGVEAHVYEVASRMASRGHDVTVLTTDTAGQLEASSQIGRIHVIRVKAWPRNRDYYYAPEVVRHILGGSWDVIHVQGYHTLVAPMAMAAAIRKKIPFVLTFHSGGHSSRIRNALRRLQHRMLAPLVRRAAQLVAVSEFEATLFSSAMKIPRERFAVVPNGAQLIEAPGTTPTPAQTPMIVSIGRLERYKGHHRAIEAFPSVLKHIPEARLRILGEGPYKQELISLTGRLGLLDRVEIGGIPMGERSTMTALLSQASLIVLLSDYEAHPIAVMEALSLKRPVLVTDSSGLSEIAKNGYATAIPLSSTKSAIADAMVREILSPHAPPGMHLPTWDNCTDRLVEVYGKVAAQDRKERSEPMAGQILAAEP
ncbi:MAG: glycosyltransferase family 4 protein [Hyphomicrobium sp.]